VWARMSFVASACATLAPCVAFMVHVGFQCRAGCRHRLVHARRVWVARSRGLPAQFVEHPIAEDSVPRWCPCPRS
jgi:hypothetical protein